MFFLLFCINEKLQEDEGKTTVHMNKNDWI